MFSLVMKDILIQKKTIALSLAYMIFFIIAFQHMGGNGFISAVVAVVYLLVNTALAYDDKNKAEVMLNSLPIKRRDLVSAKYISIFVYSIMEVVFYFLASLLIKVTGIPVQLSNITPLGIISGLFSVVLLNSIYLPLFFKMGYIKSKWFSFILFFIFFFGVVSLMEHFQRGIENGATGVIFSFLRNASDIQVLFSISVVVLILALVSYAVSIILYNNREF